MALSQVKLNRVDGNLGIGGVKAIENNILFIANAQDGATNEVTARPPYDFQSNKSGDHIALNEWVRGVVDTSETFLSIDSHQIYKGTFASTDVSSEAVTESYLGSVMSFTLANADKIIKNSSVVVTDDQANACTWNDLGNGTLTPDNSLSPANLGVSGTINYATGEVDLTYTSDPSGITATVDYSHWNATPFKTDTELDTKQVWALDVDKVYLGDENPTAPMTEVTAVGSLIASGTPYESLTVVVKVITGGALGVMTYKISYDAGITYGTERTSSTSLTPIDYDIEILFGAATYVANTTFTFTTSGALRSNTIYEVRADDYQTIVGSGLLKDYLTFFFNSKHNLYGYPEKAYVIKPENDVAGALGDITESRLQTGTISDNTITLSGSPVKDMHIVVKIVLTGGDCETAQYTYSKDGGDTWSNVYVTPVSSNSAYIGDGLLLTFTDVANGWQVGDIFEWTDVTGPTASEPLKALTPSLTNVETRDNVKQDGRFSTIACCFETNRDDWLVITQILNQIRTEGYYVNAILQTEERGSMSFSAFVEYLEQISDVFVDDRVLITPFWVNGLNLTNIPAVVPLATRFAVLPVQQSAMNQNHGFLANIDSVVNFSDFKRYLNRLSDAKYTVLREYIGYEGYYFDKPYLFSSVTSDYQYDKDIRTIQKLMRSIQYRAIAYSGRDLEPEITIIKVILSQIESSVIVDMGDALPNLRLVLANESTAVTELETEGKIRYNAWAGKRALITNQEINVGYQPASYFE